MVTLRTLDEEIDETIENISLETSFKTIVGYCLEHMIDEPKVSAVYKINGRLLLYGDNVTFEIKDYYEKEEISF